jgi:tripeptide aminopeptidase
MGKTAPDFDVDRAIDWLMRFLAVAGVTGEEKAIGREVVKVLGEVGVPSSAVSSDKAHQDIPLPTQTGNLIVKLKGTRPGQHRLFSTHLDTVPLCAGAKPIRKGNRIVTDGTTALGADNRTGVACLVNCIANLIKKNLPHPPTTFLFTVREESGLWGARFVKPDSLGPVTMGFNVDGGKPDQITIGAVGADRWSVEIRGKASHAGVYPERGISSTLVAALALAEVHKGGWFGLVHKNGIRGTSNVGPFGDGAGGSAGAATNVVTDYVRILGESRSHDTKLIDAITRAYRDAFQNAAKQVTDDKGKSAKVKFQVARDYYPFKLDEQSTVVRQALTVAVQAGFAPVVRLANGGLDANWLVRHGIPTITFGAGQNNPHTVNEYADLKDFERGCRYALALATAPDLAD